MKRLFSYVAIPCADFSRAFDFYDKITRGKLVLQEEAPFPMAYFVDDDRHNIGHLFRQDGFLPSQDGPLVFLSMEDDINDTLLRIEAAGGQVVQPKTDLGPGKGHWALFLDTEGNRLALYGTA